MKAVERENFLNSTSFAFFWAACVSFLFGAGILTPSWSSAQEDAKPASLDYVTADADVVVILRPRPIIERTEKFEK